MLPENTSRSRRSWLLLPASKPDEVTHAPQAGADVIVLDVAELVAEQDKPRARAALRELTASAGGGGPEVFVQIDAGLISGDVEAAAWPGVSGIVISRLESVEQVSEAAALLERVEKDREIAKPLQIVAAFETAAGNHLAHDILRASSRIWGATLGRADLIMDLRPEPDGEIHLMPYLMQRLIIVAGAAGVTPLGAWWRAPARGLLAAPGHTFEAGRRGRAIGFKGAMCLRAQQVDSLNRAYA